MFQATPRCLRMLHVVSESITGYTSAMLRLGSCDRPAGESPVRVGAGALGSRPRLEGEIPMVERGVESLFGGSKRVGWDCSLVSRDRSYKPMVKSSGGQRESDGVVVRAGLAVLLAGGSPVGPTPSGVRSQ